MLALLCEPIPLPMLNVTGLLQCNAKQYSLVIECFASSNKESLLQVVGSTSYYIIFHTYS